MKTTHRVLALAAVSALVVLPGCGDDGGATEPAGEAEQRNESSAPEFDAELPPGLSSQQLWSVKGAGAAYVVGDAVALRQPKGAVFAFHDLESGDRLGRIDLDQKAREAHRAAGDSSEGENTWAGTWRGEPVLYLASVVRTESDGLSEETSTRVIEAYGTDGELVGSVSQADLDTDSFTVVNGWVLLQTQVGEDGFGAETQDEWGIATPEGELVVDSVCGEWSSEECSVWTTENRVQVPSASFPAIIGDVAFGTEPAAQDGDKGEIFDDGEDPGNLVATDLSTGEPLWTSADIEAPVGVPGRVDGVNPYPVAAVGDSQLVLHWRHEVATGYDTSSTNPTTPAVHDLPTGELAVTGPSELDVNDGADDAPPPSYLIDQNAEVAVLTGSPEADQSTAYDLATGESLWESETAFRPDSVIGDVLYGYRGPDDTRPIAIRISDRKVLLEDFGQPQGGGASRVPVPRSVLDGTAGLVQHGGATYVFPAAE